LEKISLAFVLLVVLIGCAAPTPLPETSTPIPSVATDTSVPAEVLILPTTGSTATAYPPLSTIWPYLAFLKKASNPEMVVFLEADGQGKRKFYCLLILLNMCPALTHCLRMANG
jgi:hypothetical protein